MRVRRAPEAGREMRALRVVLIDDVAFVRDAIAALMRNAGHDIVGLADDGAAGLRETVAHRPDLIDDAVDHRVQRLELIAVQDRAVMAAHVPGVLGVPRQPKGVRAGEMDHRGVAEQVLDEPGARITREQDREAPMRLF